MLKPTNDKKDKCLATRQKLREEKENWNKACFQIHVDCVEN
jgi:hypothetical protein